MNEIENSNGRTARLFIDAVQSEAHEEIKRRRSKLHSDIARAVDRFFGQQRNDEYYRNFGCDGLRYRENRELVKAVIDGRDTPIEIVSQFEKQTIDRVLAVSRPKEEAEEAGE
jgi:hypothetical protein